MKGEICAISDGASANAKRVTRRRHAKEAGSEKQNEAQMKQDNG